MKNEDMDKSAVQARKKAGRIPKPNPKCTHCKGKGEGDPKLRLIKACPFCYIDTSEAEVKDKKSESQSSQCAGHTPKPSKDKKEKDKTREQ